MKFHLTTAIAMVCLLFPGLVQAQVTFSAGDLETIEKQERDAGAAKLFPRNEESTANYDVKWYRCMWNIDPAVKAISGNVTTLFTPVGNALDSLVFDLNQVLDVDSVVYHNHTAPWSHLADLLTVRFPLPIAQNSADSVTVYYHGVPPDNGFGSFEQGNHNGAPIIWTLSEPYGSSDWWPCKNGLTDKADSIDIFIRAPAAYKTASNGLLVSETAAGPEIVHHWKHRYPVASYLVCLAVTNYARFTQQVPYNDDTLLVVNYVYPEDSATAAAQTAAIIPMIQLYDTLFGVYPFQREKYGHAQFGWGGGMEHQTMTFVSSFGFELIAHELAHMWFGDKVTCGSWSDIWLNEGFATYLSGLCYEHLSPIYWQRFREVRVKSITNYPGGSVYCTDTTSVARIFDSRLSYAKGAMILHQLRWIMGDSVFFAALNNYLSDASLGYGFARTENLKSHFESSYGHDLTWYFNDWYTGEGFPSYHINWEQNMDIVVFNLIQTQSHPSVPFFRMTIPVQFKNTSRDTIIRFDNVAKVQTFVIRIPFKVDSVIFDPEYQLISRNNTVNGVTEYARQQHLEVFPNPASGRLTFRFTENSLKYPATIAIYDHAGRLTGEIDVPEGKTDILVNTAGYSPGLYYYRVKQDDIRISGKFMIVHE